jgi:S1-C subfamily serine protease
MKIAVRTPHRLGIAAAVTAAMAGAITIAAGAAQHPESSSSHIIPVSGTSKTVRLTEAERTFVDGVVLDSLSNSRLLSTASTSISPPPALSSFGKTLSAVKQMSPATVKRPDTASVSAGTQRLEAIYAGHQLSVEQKKFQTTIARDAAAAASSSQYPVLDMGHGVSGVELQKITGGRDSKTISGRAVYWAVMGQVQPSGKIAWAEPMNTVVITAHMTHLKSEWKIDSLSWSFTPGNEP